MSASDMRVMEQVPDIASLVRPTRPKTGKKPSWPGRACLDPTKKPL
jgi:hypothetical protein